MKFANLHAHTSMGSMLDALVSVDQMFDKAKELGMVAAGVTDHGTLAAHFDAFKASKRTEGNRVGFDYSRQPVCVNHYYFYIQDADFGPAFIKVCTYAPFAIKVCLNGHELKDPAAEIRAKASILLARKAKQQAVKPLMEIILSEEFYKRDYEEKASFFRALGETGSQEVVPILQKIAAKKNLFGKGKWEEMRICATNTLKMLGGQATAAK